MYKDPTEWREGFKRWKETGESPWEAGKRLPKFANGTEGGFVEEDPAVSGYQEAKKFIEDYSKSEGFKERFRNGNWKAGFRGSKYDLTTGSAYTWDFTPKRLPKDKEPMNTGDDPLYNYDTKEIRYKPMRFPAIDPDTGYKLGLGYADIFAHEFGHALDHAIHRYFGNPELLKVEPTREDVRAGYSRSIPILRQSKAYKLRIKEHSDYGFPIREHQIDLYMSQDDGHDALPEESYADLVQMRFLANKYGIFDSKKAGQKFTEEHLKQYKKKNVPNRLLNNFSDSLIIWMMNNIAQQKPLINPLSV